MSFWTVTTSMAVIALFSLLLSTFASVTLDVMMSQIIPAVAIILMAAVGMLVFSGVLGKILKINPWLAMGISMCCYIGYPGSQIVSEEVIRGTTDLTEEESKICTQLIVPPHGARLLRRRDYLHRGCQHSRRFYVLIGFSHTYKEHCRGSALIIF